MALTPMDAFLQALSISKKYTDETVVGGGAIKGKNCTILDVEPVATGNRITFKWYLDDGTEQTTYIVVTDGTVAFDDLTPAQRESLKGEKGDPGEKGDKGKGIKASYVDMVTNHVIVVYDDDTTDDWGEITIIDTGALSNDLNAAIAVGGITAGTQYEAGTPFETIFRDMLEPTLYPTLTAPSASITYAVDTYYAVGATVPAKTATVALNRGSINPAYGTSGYRSGTATGYSVSTSGADTEYSDSSDNSGAFSVPALTRSTKGNIVITGTASYAEGEQPKDSKGGDYDSPLAAGSKSASKTIQFILPYFYGASNSATIADFTGMTQSVTAKGQKTFNYTTNNQYMVFAYDSSYGNLKTILDGNGFDVTGGWTKSTLTVDGFTYNVYISNSPTTDTNAPFTFKY